MGPLVKDVVEETIFIDKALGSYLDNCTGRDTADRDRKSISRVYNDSCKNTSLPFLKWKESDKIELVSLRYEDILSVCCWFMLCAG